MMDKTDYSNNTCYYSTVTDRVYYYYSSLLLVPYYNNNIIINRRRFYYYLFVIIIILYGFDEVSNNNTRLTIVVDAFATGAGGCERGQAAVDGIHLIGDNERIVLVEINPGWILEINNIPVTQYDIIHIRPNGKYRFSVISSSLTNTTTFFKGALIRIEQGSGTNITFIPEDTIISKQANVCLFPIYGITHVDNTIKSTLSGTFSTTLEDDVRIDITVVTYNNNSGSVFSHRAYTASVIPAPSPSSYMTFQPTQSFQPTNTLFPTTTTTIPCYVCGSPDLYVSNFNATIILDNYLYTCKQIEDMGRHKQFTSDQCINAVQAITSTNNNCNCSNTLSTTTTISPMPTTTTITPTITPSSTTTTTTTMYPTMSNNSSDDNITNVTTTLIPTISPPIEASTTTSSAAVAASMTRTTSVLLGRITTTTTTTTTTTNFLLLFTTIIIPQVVVWGVLF